MHCLMFQRTRFAMQLFRCRRNVVPLIQSSLVRTRFYSAEAAAAIRPSGGFDHEEIKPFSAIPGPKPLPVLRNLLEFRKNLPRLHLFLEECYEKYGSIFKLETPGNNNFVMTTDPNHLENILRAEGKYPMRDNNSLPNMEWIIKDLKYPVMFGTQTGPSWKEGRTAAGNQIKPRNVFSYTAGLNSVAARFTEYLKSAKDENHRISDISMPLRRLLMDMSAKFVYDTDIHAFDNPTEETEEFIDAVALFFSSLGRLFIEPPLFKLYKNKLYRDFSKSFKHTKEYGLKHAEKVRQRIENKEEGSEVQGLLEQWLREGKMTEEQALMLSADMFFAGVDTTSNQAAFMLYCMAKNPEAQEELYRQIRSVLGERAQPTAEDLSKIPLLKGCMMESFRMCSVTLGNPRLLEEETTLMGYHIPANTNVWYLSLLAGKNEQLFPNPEKFDPARWARDKPNPFTVLPFGFGPRSCYGKRFAELELKLILCQITQTFVLGTEVKDLASDRTMSGIMKPPGDLPLFLKERE